MMIQLCTIYSYIIFLPWRFRHRQSCCIPYPHLRRDSIVQCLHIQQYLIQSATVEEEDDMIESIEQQYVNNV